MRIREPGVYDDVTDTEYHGDTSSLSSSGARKILPPGCPAAFKHERDHGKVTAAHFDEGHAAHSLVLGVGLDIVEVAAESWQTKAAREERQAAYDAGKVPLLSAKVSEIKAMAAAIADHPLAAELLADGVAETSAYCLDPATWTRLRARADWRTAFRGQPTIVDYKTSKNADPSLFRVSASGIGYHCQDPWYRDVFAACGIEIDRFIFVVQEKTPPYLISVHEFSDDDVALGRRLNRLAIDIYAACVAEDYWPGYGDHIHSMRLTARARYFAEELLS
ncbi:hypothetical protein FG87_22010 [Nocardia vulneris]|uniref:Putative exodeoxyribonuclease 8 PDDEXK-like domain-containing protein n=1 Tax=Nocardia vulneris TaxID=1141657 RepID=A0ABR4ZCF2_9NOCA|nr:hypothetical protein FG87_22010 [Nocardia vulneris]